MDPLNFTKETNPLIYSMYFNTNQIARSVLLCPMGAQETQRAKVIEVNRLLDSGSDPNEMYRGKSAIYYAILLGLHELVDRFLDAGVQVSHAADIEHSVFHAMVTRTYFEKMETRIPKEGLLLQKLLLAGADIHMRDADGNTLLHYAQYHVNPTMIKLLVDAGLDINSKNNEGRTVLHNCISNWRMETINVILAAEPDINARDNAGFTVLYYAIKGIQLDMPRDAMPESSRYYTRATLDVIRRLIDAKAATDFIDSEGNSLLHLAMYWGYNDKPYMSYHQSLQKRSDLVALLIECGLDANARNHMGQTPLMLAVLACDVDTIRYLCGIPGIVRNAHDIMRNSALSYAEHGLRLSKCHEERSIDLVPPMQPLLPYEQPLSRAVAGNENIPFIATPDDYTQIIHLITA